MLLVVLVGKELLAPCQCQVENGTGNMKSLPVTNTLLVLVLLICRCLGNLGVGSPPGSGYQTEIGSVNGTGAVNGSWSNTGGSTTGDLIGVAFDATCQICISTKTELSLNSGVSISYWINKRSL